MADHRNASKIQQPRVEPNVAELTVMRAEENAAIIKIDGWNMRVYFDKSLSDQDKERIAAGRIIKVEYLGNLNDVHSLKLLPLK